MVENQPKPALHKKSAFCDVPKQSISTFCASAYSAQKVKESGNSLDADRQLAYNRLRRKRQGKRRVIIPDIGRQKRETVPLTVCIAALCEHGRSVVMTADRMITAGDIVEFESPMTNKVLPLTSAILLLTAGDSTAQSEIYQRLRRELKPILNTGGVTIGKDKITVAEVAEMYSRHHRAFHIKEAENQSLGRFGLDSKAFLEQQQTLSPDFVNEMTAMMLDYRSPHVEAIIAGIDGSGGHIYFADKDHVRCHDNIGFAAIGVGGWHADSQFMFAGYAKWASMPKCLLLSYAAKKRSEVAPGVGQETDMFAIIGMPEPRLHNFVMAYPYVQISQLHIDNLAKIYDSMIRTEAQALSSAVEAAETLYEELEDEASQALQEAKVQAEAYAEERNKITRSES